MTAVAATARRSRRQIQAGLDVVVSDGGNRLNKKKRSALNDGNGKHKEMRPAVSDRRVTRFASKQQELVALDGGDRFNKKKRSALNDGNGKQKEMRPAVSKRRVTRFASKQQELEKDENRRIQDYGFDVGDIPPTVFGELMFEPCWMENSLGRAPMEFEDLAKIGLKTFNLQNGTSYEFTKIVRVNILMKYVYEAYQIIFLAGGDSFVAKAGTIGNFTVVPFCKKGLDVSAEQTKTLPDLTRAAIKEQLEERQKLLIKENQRIKEGHGLDFEGDTLVNLCGKFNPCWSESSGSPAPKIDEEMSKIGINSYNRDFETWFRFVKLLRVYFHKEGKGIRDIYFEAEDTSAASFKDFHIIVRSDDEKAVVCRFLEDEISLVSTWAWYWCAAEFLVD